MSAAYESVSPEFLVFSPRAAAEFGYILVEGLCGEFQPFDRGQIRKDRLSERPCGHAEYQRHCQCLNRVRPLRCCDLTAQQAVGLRVGHQLNHAAGIACSDGGNG